jgi:hypothetical protein
MTCELTNPPIAEHPLVRRVDGVELPIAGTWTVEERHATVTFSRPRMLAHADSWLGRAKQASVIVGEEVDDVTVSMVVDAPGLPAIVGSPGRSVGPVRPQEGPSSLGEHRWPLWGKLKVNGVAVPVEATLAYQGVWRHGDRHYGWFVLSGVIVDGDRPRRRMRFTFELLAQRPCESTAAAIISSATRFHARRQAASSSGVQRSPRCSAREPISASRAEL